MFCEYLLCLTDEFPQTSSVKVYSIYEYASPAFEGFYSDLEHALELIEELEDTLNDLHQRTVKSASLAIVTAPI